jgi:hypothetical protein
VALLLRRRGSVALLLLPCRRTAPAGLGRAAGELLLDGGEQPASCCWMGAGELLPRAGDLLVGGGRDSGVGWSGEEEAGKQ